MLIEFSVGNYRSFKETVTFSMVAAKISAKDKKLDENNVFIVDKQLSLLKSAAIYGANASGKSNLAKAVDFMRWFVLNSSKETQTNEAISVERFLLSEVTEHEPSFFEIIFILNGTRFRYGFEADYQKIISEWLFYVRTSREARLFERNGDQISVSTAFKGGKGIRGITRSNALFLSVAAQFNVETAENILSWFSNNLNISVGIESIDYRMFTIQCLENIKYRDKIIHLIKELDLGIDDIQKLTAYIPNEWLPEDGITDHSGSERPIMATIMTAHKIYDYDNHHSSNALLDMKRNESEGTQKLFTIAGHLINALENRKVLLIDELDARLHPLITSTIIDLFNSNVTNPNNAQLIFMTHDTNLLSHKIFRRDQIWFTEKDRYGATHLYSLAEYKVRNDASFESDYIEGRYGAVPFIGSLNHLVG